LIFPALASHAVASDGALDLEKSVGTRVRVVTLCSQRGIYPAPVGNFKEVAARVWGRPYPGLDMGKVQLAAGWHTLSSLIDMYTLKYKASYREKQLVWGEGINSLVSVT